MPEPITLNWLRGDREAILRIGEVEALDDILHALPRNSCALDFRFRLAQAAHRGSLAYADVDVKEIKACVRLALIGAGASRAEAAKDADKALEEEEISALALACYTLISIALAGKDHDPVGEMVAGAASNESASPASTEMVQP